MGKKGKKGRPFVATAAGTGYKAKVDLYGSPTPEQLRSGVDAKGQPLCRRHPPGVVWFMCTCGHVYGLMNFEVLSNPVGCSCRGHIRTGTDEDACVVVKQHDEREVCYGTRWHELFGDVNVWLNNFENAVLCMWTVVRADMSKRDRLEILGTPGKSRFRATIGLMLNFFGASQLVLLTPIQASESIRLAKYNMLDIPGSTQTMVKELRAWSRTKLRPPTYCMSVFSEYMLGKKLYPTTSTDFAWVLDNYYLPLGQFVKQCAKTTDDQLTLDNALRSVAAGAVVEVSDTAQLKHGQLICVADTINGLTVVSSGLRSTVNGPKFVLKKLKLPDRMGMPKVVLPVVDEVQIAAEPLPPDKQISSALAALDLAGRRMWSRKFMSMDGIVNDVS